MLTLSQHIEILLLEHDCVIVPGLGAFMAHHQPAEYSEADGLWYPPQRTVGFNAQLNINDALLPQSYADACDVSYPEALRLIEREVEGVKRTLADEGRYEFYGIGTLLMAEGGGYDFQPCEAGLLTPSLYGLATCAFTQTKKVAIATEADAPAPAAEEEEATEAAPTYYIYKWIAAAAVVVFFILATLPAGRGSEGVTQCSLLPIATSPAPAMRTTLTPDTAQQADEQPAAATADTLKAPKAKTVQAIKALPAVDDSKSYTIVLASHVSRDGASDYIDSLSRLGFHRARVRNSASGVRKVVYGTYSSRDEAESTLRALRSGSKHFREAWVLEI